MIRRLLIFLLLVFSSVFAQTPEQLADQAVTDWLAQPALAPDQLLGLSAEEICEELPGMFQLGAPLPGTTVNFDNRLAHDTDDENELLFTYPAAASGDRYDVVEVRLVADDADAWVVDHVGYRLSSQVSGVRAWMQTPLAAMLFSITSLLVLWLLFSPGKNFLRRALQLAGMVLREHRRLVIITMVVFYGAFAFGAFLGSGLPAKCADAVMGVLQQALTQVGATEAYGSGNIPRAATLTFYQNFGMVTSSVIFPLAALFGVPAYLFSFVSFTAQGIPFGFISGAGPLEIAAMLVVLILELTAYFLVTAGGGMLLATVFKHGLRGFLLGLQKLVLMIPIAFILLMIGAWFEAAVLLL